MNKIRYQPVKLQLELPPDPIKYQIGERTILIDACVQHLLEGTKIWEEQGELYIEQYTYSSRENAAGKSRHAIRRQLSAFIYECQSAQGRFVSSAHRIVFADGNPLNMTMENMRLERRPVELPAPRRRIA